MILLLLTSLAHAQGTALWLRGPADPAATVDLVDQSLEDVVPDQSWSSEDARAIEALAAELEAVRPLVEVFDGELQIMGRLARAIDDVHVLRGDEDRALVTRALRFQGFAVRRYFQDGLATDPAAEPYRVRVGDAVEVGPWVDAVALDPDHEGDAADIPEEPERAAFGATRARVLAMPRATLDFGAMPAGATARVDGRPLEPASDGSWRATVLPGMHHASIVEGEAIVARGRVRLAPGEVHSLRRRPTRSEMGALAASLETLASPVRLDPVVLGALDLLDRPVRLVVPSPGGPVVYDVEGAWAVHRAPEPLPVPAPEPEPEPEPERAPPRLAATAAMAWVYDPAYAAATGAPPAAEHAFAAQIGASLVTEFGPVIATVGVDVAAPTSPFGELEEAGATVRARIQPWLGLGPTAVPLTLTIGGLLPSHLALGLRARWPMEGPVAITGGWNEGIPLGVDRAACHVAWIGVTGSTALRPGSPDP